MSGQGTRIARGAAWSAWASAIGQVVGFVTGLLAARILGPEVLGVVGMASAVTLLFQSLSDLGLSASLISGRLHERSQLATAHWTVVLASLFFAAAVIGLAPLAAWFFKSPELVALLRMQALGLPCLAACVVPRAVLQRQGRLRELAWLAVVQQLSAGLGVVVCLALGLGVWSMILPAVVAQATAAAMHWRSLGAWPRFAMSARLSDATWAEARGFASYVTLNHVARHADDWIVGRWFGSEALGLYALAYGLLRRPISVMSQSVVPALVPAMSRVSGEPARLGALFVRAIVYSLRVTAAPLAIAATLAHLIVSVLLGEAWLEAVFLSRVFLLAAIAQVVGPLFGALAMAVAPADFWSRWGLVTAAAMVCCVLVGAMTGGVDGVAIAYACFSVCVAGWMLAVAKTRFEVPLEGLAAGFARVGRDVVVVALGTWACDRALAGVGAAPWVRLVVAGSTGSLVYLGLFRWLGRAELEVLVAFAPGPWSSRLTAALGLRRATKT